MAKPMTKRQLSRVGAGWQKFFLDHPEFAALRPEWAAPKAVNDEGGTFDFGRAAITRRLLTVERGSDSYYAQHRAAKGDTSEVAQDDVAVSGDADWLRQVAGTEGRTDGDGELWQRCVALASVLGI